jgi:isopentenyl diphosphate isomerase/L-lactate dehydrogenase-like FMN-dependent dehydrogenase
MNVSKALSISDLRQAARRRLPKILFELIESGVEDEYGLSRNLDAFGNYRILPRYLGAIAERDQGVRLFGHDYASPFGIAPTGFAALLRNGADRMLAETAREANIPFIISGASAAPIEHLAELGPDHVWYHIYPAKDQAITTDILRRVRDAGLNKLVLTVDNPVYPNRERDTRNGFSLPLRLRPSILLEALTHPAWIAHYFRHGGMPFMDTWARYAGKDKNAAEVAAFFRSQSPSIQTWSDIERLRQEWPGTFILKGIQHPDDAVRAADLGIDGIIVSNHGGKSFDPLPSPLETLPMVSAALGGRIPVMMDSGVRRGYHALIAKALGADFVFVGRATLYGVVADGRRGAAKAVDLLRREIDQSLALAGASSFAGIDASYLLGAPGAAPAVIPPSAEPREQNP